MAPWLRLLPFALVGLMLVGLITSPASTSDSTIPSLVRVSSLSAGGDDKTDFVDTVSNLHAPSDIGTHSSFAEMQDKDAVYDTLTEADTDSATSTFGKTSGSGTSYRTTAANEVRLGVFSASSNGEVASIVFYGRGSSATNCKAIITDSSGTLLENGVGAATAVSTTAGTKTLTYSAGSRPIVTSGTTYWVGMIWQAAGRVYYQSTTGATSKQDTSNSYTTPTNPTDAGSTTETWRLMYANVNDINYGVDLEVGWTAADYDEENEELCIYGGTQNAEALKVDVWAGSWTNVFADLAAGWNNVSVSSYLTSSAFEIRFVDARTTPDVVSASTWQVEAVLLHCWTVSSGEDYNVTVYESISLDDTSKPSQELTITIDETLAIDETPTIVMSLVLTIFQSVLVVGVATSKIVFFIFVFENIAISSLVSPALDATIRFFETVSIGSLVSSTFISTIRVFETVSISSLVSPVLDATIKIFQTVSIESLVSSAWDTTLRIFQGINIYDLTALEINPPIVLNIYVIIGITAVSSMITEFNIFYELFLSLQMWGYFGPLALVLIGYYVTKREKGLGIFFIIVDSLIIYMYVALVAATPQYWWHIFILILGVIQCTFRLVSR